MNPRKPKFDWAIVIIQLPCGIIIFLCALVVDKVLRSFGVDIHPWREALYSSIAAVFFAALLFPLASRLGLVFLSHYFLAAIALFIPCTIIFLIVLAQGQSLLIAIDDPSYINSQGRAWSMSLSIRLARTAVLMPIHVITFWLIYHKIMGRKNR